MRNNHTDFLVKLKAGYNQWRGNYDVKTFMNSFGSLLLTMFFALYNGFLGAMHASPWHGGICIYYLLLVFLRSLILLTEKQVMHREVSEAKRIRLKIYLLCTALLLVLNLCMIGPISMLVRMQRPVNMTLITAITMAVYAFFKMSVASVNLVKRKRSINCLVKLLRAINFIDALMSILALQNTLIMVTDHVDNKMTLLPLTAASSGLIWLITVILSFGTLVSGIRRWKKDVGIAK